MLLGDYPFLEVMWSMFIFFAWVIFIYLLILVLADNFRRTDHTGWAKAGWTLFVIFVPLIGVFAYLIANGDGMASRSAAQGRDRHAGPDESAPSGDGAAEIERARRLLDSGTITQAEFDAIKTRAVS
jgi:hypothetical protein